MTAQDQRDHANAQAFDPPRLTDQAYLPRTCTACGGEGEYIVGDWRQGYPKGRCAVCRGTGRMVRDRTTGEWTSAPKVVSR